VYVTQQIGYPNYYGLFLFKDRKVGTNNSVSITWRGKSTMAPATSTAYLQMYNRNTLDWDTKASNNLEAANTDFTLNATVIGLEDYKDASGWVSCRVYQKDI
jgi:hypothetical protein